MYVTRRLLRSTLEETTAVKQEPVDDTVISPRKRRPLLQTPNDKETTPNQQITTKASPANSMKSKRRENSTKQAENQGDKRNKAGKRSNGPRTTLKGMGLLVDAHDSKERWCEAKILDLNVADKSVFIHYIGWNSRYDCWIAAKCVAAHGSHTGVKPTPGSSWNGKDSLFRDPSAPNRPTKTAKTTTPKATLPKLTTKKKKRPQPDDVSNDEKISPASKRTSNRSTVKVKVEVNAVDEETEQKARRGSRRSEKIDLELDMDVQGDTDDVKSPPKRLTPKTSKPTPISTTKSPTSNRKPSPRTLPTVGVDNETKTESDEPPTLQSPTVGMSVLRRSARASLSRRVRSKKRKNEDDDSDEEYKDEEEEDDEDDEDDEEDDEVDESDEDIPVRRSNSKARRGSASRSISSSTITQWQTNPAYAPTRERLATIFRHRLQQRGELGEFHGSFQQAMSSSSTASTPRSTEEETPKEKGPKKKKTKTAHRVMDDEEKAAAAQFYYAQHYYQMQAIQYQQYMYQQALMAQQLEQQRLLASQKKTDGTTGEDREEKEENESKLGDDEEKAATPASSSSATDEAPIMNGGIIDPRFIHARMDALEQQKRVQLYYQHYAQTTERNLQMLASTPEFLHTGANLWREQLQHGRQPQDEQKKSESAEAGSPTPKKGDVTEEKEPVVPKPSAGPPCEKSEESRGVESAKESAPSAGTESKTPLPSTPSQTTTPEATPEAIEKPTTVTTSDATKSPSNPKPKEAVGSGENSANETKDSQSEAVLFELVL